MEKVIIFGDSMFSSVVYQTIEREKLAEVLSFTLNEKYIHNTVFEGKSIVPFEKLSDYYDMTTVKIVITVGYSNMNRNRKYVYEQCKKAGYQIWTLISQQALIYSNDIEEGSIILPTAFVGPHSKIGKCVILWNQVCVPHHSRVGDFSYLSPGTIVGGSANIGNNCFIGMNCSIKNGIDVGPFTFIGANSYMNKATEGGLFFVGNPAKNNKNITSDYIIQFLK